MSNEAPAPSPGITAHPVARALFFVAWMAAGCYLTISGGIETLQGLGNRGWIRTQGEVLESRIAEEAVGDRVLYRAVVEYKYKVEDTWRRGDLFDSRYRPSADPADAEAVLERYGEGTRLMVYYDPDQPADSVVERRGRTNAWIELLVGSSVIAVAVTVAMMSWRRRPST